MLRELSYNTYYWMRSSADGRFVANGRTGGDGAAIADLQADKDISVKAAYDPGFFPDNRGWVFQGTPIGAGLLLDGAAAVAIRIASTSARPRATRSRASACTSTSVRVSAAATTSSINSQFTSDHPSPGETSDPSAAFGATATMKLTPMMYDGTHYTGKPSVTLELAVRR